MLKYKLKAILLALISLALPGYAAAAPVENLNCQGMSWFETTYDVSPLSNRTDVHEVFLYNECSGAAVYNIASYDQDGAQDEAFKPFQYQFVTDESNSSRLIVPSGDLPEGVSVELRFNEGGAEFRHNSEKGGLITATLTSQKPKYPYRQVGGLTCDDKLKTLTSHEVETVDLVLPESCDYLAILEYGETLRSSELNPDLWTNDSHVFEPLGKGLFRFYKRGDPSFDMNLSFQ